MKRRAGRLGASPSDRLRLLYLQPAVGMGGAERQASLVLPHLARFGVDATVVAGPGTAVIDWFDRAGVWPYLWSRHFPDGEPFSLRRMPTYVAELSRLVAELDELHRTRPFDVVLGSLGYGWAAAGIVARRWGIPSVWRAGGLSFGQTTEPASALALGGNWLARLFRPALVVCNAQAVRRHWEPMLGVPMRVVPNGVALPERRRRRERREGEPLAVGFAGRLAPEKGLPVLFEACAMARSRGVDVRLVLAGPGETSELERLLHLLGLSPHAELAGPLADLEPFWERCDALVLPSTSEGCANVLLEGMARGVPVIATNVGGTPEIVRHGRDGWLVPPRSQAQLARAIELFARNPAFAARLGAAGRLRAESFSPDSCARGLAMALEEAVLVTDSMPRQTPARTSALRTPA